MRPITEGNRLGSVFGLPSSLLLFPPFPFTYPDPSGHRLGVGKREVLSPNVPTHQSGPIFRILDQNTCFFYFDVDVTNLTLTLTLTLKRCYGVPTIVILNTTRNLIVIFLKKKSRETFPNTKYEEPFTHLTLYNT